MGSLTSRPSLPPVQQPVIYTLPAYVPPPAVSSAPAPAAPQTLPPSSPSAANGTPPSAPSEEAQCKTREEGLLGRSRGRLGTVLTGLRGVLSDAVTGAARKTLLGE